MCLYTFYKYSFEAVLHHSYSLSNITCLHAASVSSPHKLFNINRLLLRTIERFAKYNVDTPSFDSIVGFAIIKLVRTQKLKLFGVFLTLTNITKFYFHRYRTKRDWCLSQRKRPQRRGPHTLQKRIWTISIQRIRQRHHSSSPELPTTDTREGVLSSSRRNIKYQNEKIK